MGGLNYYQNSIIPASYSEAIYISNTVASEPSWSLLLKSYININCPHYYKPYVLKYDGYALFFLSSKVKVFKQAAMAMIGVKITSATNLKANTVHVLRLSYIT
jgi:hypothetical protein